MNYVEGFVLAVPKDKKDEYLAQAAKFTTLVKEFGATRHVECWGEDVPDGKITDFRRACQAQEGEEVVFSWFEYPSKEVREAANLKMRSDPRMEALGKDMPFDGKRMIYGGFTTILDV